MEMHTKSSSHVALISNIQEDLEHDVDGKDAKKMKVEDQFQRCRVAQLQRTQSRSNFADKNVTFIMFLSFSMRVMVGMIDENNLRCYKLFFLKIFLVVMLMVMMMVILMVMEMMMLMFN